MTLTSWIPEGTEELSVSGAFYQQFVGDRLIRASQLFSKIAPVLTIILFLNTLYYPFA